MCQNKIEQYDKLVNCLKDTFLILLDDALQFRADYIKCNSKAESESLLCQLDSYFYMLSTIADQLESFGINPKDLNLGSKEELELLLVQGLRGK